MYQLWAAEWWAHTKCSVFLIGMTQALFWALMIFKKIKKNRGYVETKDTFTERALVCVLVDRYLYFKCLLNNFESRG